MLLIPALLVLGTLLLAWSNGANDNFKGVATLYGSGVLGYRAALAYASLATLAGGLVSVLLAERLARTFSGEAVLHGGALDPTMLAAMLVAAGTTVLLATFASMPTSTTHALMGSLVGVALAVDPSRIRFDRLGALFFGPMLLSPFLAILLAALLFYVGRFVWQRRASMSTDPCLCVVPAEVDTLPAPGGTLAMSSLAPGAGLTLIVGSSAACTVHSGQRLARVDVKGVANLAHGLSGGAVCFARALNDTPKIAAVLLATGALAGWGKPGVLALVTFVVVVGGLVQSRGVARTMSRRITRLHTGSGLTANVVTAGLVLWASRLGLPVSTTHVSCGSIFGIGAATRRADGRTIRRILSAWIVTFPLGAALGAGLFRGLLALGA